MRISPTMRGGCVCAAVVLVFSLSVAASFAHMGASVGRPAVGGGHFAHFAPHGFNRGFEAGRLGFNRFGRKRFDRFGFDRFNRFGFNRFGGNQLFLGGWGWGDWGGVPSPTAASEPIIVESGAPVIINVGVDPGPGDVANGLSGGCVIHKLDYDSNGKYVGERQIPQC